MDMCFLSSDCSKRHNLYFLAYFLSSFLLFKFENSYVHVAHKTIGYHLYLFVSLPEPTVK